MKNKKTYKYVLTTYNDETRFARANSILGLIRDFNKSNPELKKQENLHVSDFSNIFAINKTDKAWNILSGKFDSECNSIA